jgi:type II secretory pathway predicted ATPase ExeA
MSAHTIYLDHFGLTGRPFTLLPDPDFLYWSPSHKQAFTVLEYGIMSRSPIIVVTGEIGSGKTTLLREFLRRIEDDIQIGLISNAQGDRGELLHWVLMSLGQTVEPDASYVQLFHQFQAALIDAYANGRRTVLIFDEAQNLSLETLEELRMFSNINSDQDELLQLILVGQPELLDKIADPSLEQFAQRVGAEFHLPRLAAKDVDRYIDHRLKVVGAERRIFTKLASEKVHLATGGTPRLINRLCDFALLYAFSEGRKTVDETTIDAVVRDQHLFSLAQAERDRQKTRAARARGEQPSGDGPISLWDVKK